MYTKVQLLQTNRISQFYESNESISLSQIFEFIVGKDVLWDNRHGHIPRCYGNSVTMATRVKPQ